MPCVCGGLGRFAWSCWSSTWSGGLQYALFYFSIIIVLDLSLRVLALRGLLVFVLRLCLFVFVGVCVRRFQRWLSSTHDKIDP
jgi:hypothetical protein